MKYTSYHKKLKSKVGDYFHSEEARRSRIAEYIKMAPEIFYLMLRLGFDKKVPLKYRTRLTAGLAYFVLPFDLIPEALSGPAGYVDDVMLAILVVHGLIRKFGPDLNIPEPSEGKRMNKFGELIAKADDVIGKSRWRKINRIYRKSIQ